MEVQASRLEPELMAFERQEEVPGFNVKQERGPGEPEKEPEAMALGGQDFNVEQGAVEREGIQERPEVWSEVAAWTWRKFIL